MKKRDEKNGGSARDRYLLELDAMCQKIQAANLSEQGPLRIPSRGGEIFISAKPCGCPGCVNPERKRSPGLQADLNAAANIGLRALLDPDWAGKWWYVPCVAATNVPDPERVKGSPLFDGNSPLGPKTATGAELGSKAKSGKPPKGKKKGSREMANRWRDVSAVPPLADENWQSTAEYWNRTESRVVENLRRDLAT